ncbi:MAG: DUF1844 domain-containing protein [Chthoniobacterales bacterium]|nr:DUF1844 domain-containing protein [Chthoniobacterales bacterium]
MPEVQKADHHDASVTQRFIEFVMLQAQQAMLCLGRLPHPATGETSVNLDAARMFIDHLELLREKTRGNLSKDEEAILGNILSELQMNFIQAQGSTPTPPSTSNLETSEKEPSKEAVITAQESEEHKKRFSKSYGA